MNETPGTGLLHPSSSHCHVSFILTQHKCSNKVSVIVQNSYFKAVEIGNVELMFRIYVLRL